ncbi:MAG: zinc carboxypeptidase [Bacteroidetes bacterium]|nr:zinc carboxypeptidase [Bacteroidota bacterium]
MLKQLSIFLVCAAFFQFGFSQVQSPGEFLGYTLGNRYTPHYKIVNYFQYLEKNNSSMVKLQQYGLTNEGRPLIVAFVSSSENINRLEDIRENNLRLANAMTDKIPVVETAPVIVWLSYNVHGNEPSSSEAAMRTIYELINPGNSKTKEWLKNTVVVIDPCINPDGRDRYVNWFNSVTGKNFNPDTYAREHREPWPGGRTNHYNFDLNRDWAWQTQLETQQRMKLYRQWLPQIHVDYHEQGINSPYYFSPAAQPFHEVITPWQREFQEKIGRNNAKYFDSNSWLFFTKEVFDLYYPSYGDTYPIYNGAIGMTYEQGGGPSGGLGVYKKEGDTLTLTDRINHHYTSGISTLEISSQYAPQLISEYRNFFTNAKTRGTGKYRTYVIKNAEDKLQDIKALTELLDKNNIEYSTGSGSAKGYNYFTRKDEIFTVDKGDIVISNQQPNSTLVSVLLEPNSLLVDSNTYDITAWSLPYIYGLKAYAVKEKLLNTSKYIKEPALQNAVINTYGYVLPWQGVQSARVISKLLQAGVRLRFASNPFEINGSKFNSGSVIVLKNANAALENNLWNLVTTVCNSEQIKAYPVSTGFVDKGYDFGSSNVHYIKPPKIILATGKGISSNAAGEIWFFLEKELDYPVTLVNADDLGMVNWSEANVLILPDGNYPYLKDKNHQEELKNWIRKGGKLIAMQNAVAELSKLDFGIHFKKDEDSSDKKDEYALLKRYGDFERDYISRTTPGSIYRVELDNTHPLAFGYPDYYYTIKLDNDVYEFIDDGWNVGVIKKDYLVAGFVGAKLKKKLNDGLVFGVENLGKGSIVFLADDVLFRNFWQNGKLLFCNALFMVGQ